MLAQNARAPCLEPYPYQGPAQSLELVTPSTRLHHSRASPSTTSPGGRFASMVGGSGRRGTDARGRRTKPMSSRTEDWGATGERSDNKDVAIRREFATTKLSPERGARSPPRPPRWAGWRRAEQVAPSPGLAGASSGPSPRTVRAGPLNLGTDLEGTGHSPALSSRSTDSYTVMTRSETSSHRGGGTGQRAPSGDALRCGGGAVQPPRPSGQPLGPRPR